MSVHSTRDSWHPVTEAAARGHLSDSDCDRPPGRSAEQGNVKGLRVESTGRSRLGMLDASAVGLGFRGYLAPCRNIDMFSIYPLLPPCPLADHANQIPTRRSPTPPHTVHRNVDQRPAPNYARSSSRTRIAPANADVQLVGSARAPGRRSHRPAPPPLRSDQHHRDSPKEEPTKITPHHW